MNSFTSIINKDLGNKVPFCTHRETVFHCFAEYQPLSKLFVFYRRRSQFLAKSLLKGFLFFGFKYTKQNFSFSILIFVLGEAKMAVYVSARMIRCRIKLDYSQLGDYKKLQDLVSFERIWCFQSALCQVQGDDFIFGEMLEF